MDWSLVDASTRNAKEVRRRRGGRAAAAPRALCVWRFAAQRANTARAAPVNPPRAPQLGLLASVDAALRELPAALRLQRELARALAANAVRVRAAPAPPRGGAHCACHAPSKRAPSQAAGAHPLPPRRPPLTACWSASAPS